MDRYGTLIVIYAGYGDALLLRTNDQPPQYWLIDGGPTSSSAQSDPKLNNVNPYYQYLVQTLRHFCLIGDKIVLNGIVVTHTDSDHVQGIKKLLDDELVTVNGPVLFNDEFYEPKYKSLLQTLVNDHFESSYPPDPVIAGLYNQSTKDIVQMRKGGLQATKVVKKPNGDALIPPLPEYKFPTTEQNTTHNIASIITISTRNHGAMDIVTTADAMALNILEAMSRVKLLAPNVQGPLSVFKVPHHGSSRNSQEGLNPVLPLEAEIGKIQDLCLAINWQKQKQLDQSGWTVDEKTVFKRGEDLVERCKDQWKPDAGVPPFTDFLKRMTPGFDIYANNYTYANYGAISDPTSLFKFCTTFKNGVDARLGLKWEGVQFTVNGCVGSIIENRPLLPGKWHKKWNMGKALAFVFDESDLVTFRVAERVYNFYSQFQAYNYVISANGTHGHPHAPVVAGIVVANIMKQKTDPTWKANLIVTDGSAVKKTFVIYIVRAVLEKLDTTIPPIDQWSSACRIYCMKDHCYVEVTHPLPDTPPHLAELKYEEEGPGYLNELYEQFNLSLPSSVPRPTDPESKTFIANISLPDGSQTNMYLDLDGEGQPLSQSTTPQLARKLIYLPSLGQMWTDQPGNLNLHGPWRFFRPKADQGTTTGSPDTVIVKYAKEEGRFKVINRSGDVLLSQNTNLEFGKLTEGNKKNLALLRFDPAV